MKKYTAAVIGTGRIGFSLGFDKKREQPASHTVSLLENKRIKLIAGCDSNSKNLTDFYNHVIHFNHGLQVYENVDLLMQCSKPDICVISVNEESHLHTALKVIDAKPKLIILEKPVALNMAEGELIRNAAQKNNVPILVNHERRFADDYNFAKTYLSKLGNLLSVNARLDSGLRVFSPESINNGEYSLLHDGTHLVDIVLFLLDENELSNISVTNITRDEKDYSVVRNINVHCSAKSCDDVNLNISGRSRYFGFEIELIGTLGRIKIGNGIYEFYQREESKLYTGFYSLKKDKSVKKYKKTGYFKNMTQNAVDFLDGKAELKSTLQTGLDTLKILEEIRKSLH